MSAFKKYLVHISKLNMYIKNVDVRVLTFLTYLQIDRAQKAELS